MAREQRKTVTCRPVAGKKTLLEAGDVTDVTRNKHRKLWLLGPRILVHVHEIFSWNDLLYSIKAQQLHVAKATQLYIELDIAIAHKTPALRWRKLQNGGRFLWVLSTHVIFTSDSSCLLPLSSTPPFLTSPVPHRLFGLLYCLCHSNDLHKCIWRGSVCILFAFNVLDVFQAHLHCDQKLDSVTF